jgi:hypothetical protein
MFVNLGEHPDWLVTAWLQPKKKNPIENYLDLKYS